MRLRSLLSIAAVSAALAAVVAISGCGGGGGSQATAMGSGGSAAGAATAAATTSNAAGPTSSAGSTVNVGNTGLGKVLVDNQGRTLYLFEADKTNMSNCSGACSTIWPAYMSSGKATAGNGVNAGMIASTAQGQVTYNGHPLYTYVGDQKPGDTMGEGLDQFGAKWYVLNPAGDKIDND
jgi:predicted lipoprotein with Yx(FWY)xxD motif